MSQINFIWGSIGKQLSLEVQFGFNEEDWNFKRQNLIFTNLIDWNQGQNRKKTEVLGSIRGQIEEIWYQGPYWKRRVNSGFKFKFGRG
jgi:hypothetical protein